MSSPSRNTRSSRSISSKSASLTASSSVTGSPRSVRLTCSGRVLSSVVAKGSARSVVGSGRRNRHAWITGYPRPRSWVGHARPRRPRGEVRVDTAQRLRARRLRLSGGLLSSHPHLLFGVAHDRFQILLGRPATLQQPGAERDDRILFLPAPQLGRIDVILRVVLRVSLAAVVAELDQLRAFAGDGPRERSAHGPVDVQHVGAVGRLGADTVPGTLLDEAAHPSLPPGGRRKGPLVRLDDQDERAALHGREVEALVPRAGRG